MNLVIELQPSLADAQARAKFLNNPPGGVAPRSNVRVVQAGEIGIFDLTANPGSETVIAKSAGPMFVVLFDEP